MEIFKSVIFTQIYPKLLLYTKWAKINFIPETSTSQISDFASEFNHFVILPRLTQNFLEFQNEQT